MSEIGGKPCEGCEPRMAQLTTAVAGIREILEDQTDRIEKLTSGVNSVGRLAESHADTLNTILGKFLEFQQHMSTVNPASLLKSLIGGRRNG